MMKWKVVRNQPRSQSADRSLECLKKSENYNPNDGPNDSNNSEEGKENKEPSNRQRASSLVRKSTECINLRSILGLARQRSETNLSSVGLVAEPARRSRSEVRLGQTRSSSPPAKGWLRGRKRERKSEPGKTVVTGSQRKKRTAGPKPSESRTDASGRKGSAGPRKSKSRRKEEDIIEEEDVYVEIRRKEEPRRAGRKKGQAPRPAEQQQPARPSPARRRPPRKGGSEPATTVVAEVHEELLYLSMDNRPAENSEYESLLPPIDTPDYSTLESTGVEVPAKIEVDQAGQFGRMDLIDQYRKHRTEEPSKAEEEAVESSGEESPPPFVVKKSFVLTIAKQEKGFQSLCAANKRPDPPPAPPAEQISVTFRCSSDRPAGEEEGGRRRSTSVPPTTQEGSLLVTRGRSRDRKSKERKKSKGKKKDPGFVMPQAVIDELSQVLEKRKPSLDDIPAFILQHSSSAP